MTGTQVSDCLQEIINSYPVRERYEHILTQIQDVLEALEILPYVEINEDLLGQAIIDYFEDIDKLKKYERIDNTNVDKIYAYQTFWLLRRKPIQLISNKIDSRYIHINEKVFTAILVAKMFGETRKGFDDKNTRIEAFIDLIYYNFKYRIFTQKSLELMVSAFFCGCAFDVGVC